MKRFIAVSTIAFAAISIGPGTASLHAQQNAMAGLWTCEQANYTVRNLAADNFTISWMMELRPDGTLVAEGTFYGAVTGYSEGIQGQGRWAQSQQGLNLDFQWLLGGQQIPAQYNLRRAGVQMVNTGQGQAGRYSISCQPAQR